MEQMRLQHVQITNCFGFADATIDLTPSFVYVLGRNSSGKTALLNAISNLSHAKTPSQDPRARNFTPTNDEPTFEATFAVTKAPADRATPYLNERLKGQVSPHLLGQVLDQNQAVKALLTYTKETYTSLMDHIAKSNALHITRTLDGNFELDDGTDATAYATRAKELRNLIQRAFPNNTLTAGNTTTPIAITAEEIERAAASIITPIYHYSEHYALAADLPDHLTLEAIKNPQNQATKAFIAYLGAETITQRLTTNDPDEQNKHLATLQERATTLANQISKTTEKLVELTLTATERGIQITIRTDGKKSFYRQISDATKFLFAYHLYSNAHRPGAVLLFDEPTRGLHASVERDINTFLQGLAEHNQVIVATHSEHLIDLDHLDGIRLMQQDDNARPIVLNKMRPPRDKENYLLALQPVFDAIGIAHTDHLITKDKTILTEGLTDFLYLRAMHVITQKNHAYGIAPGRGEGSMFTIIPFFISQGVKLKIIIDTPTHKDRLQDAYGIPEQAFWIVPGDKKTRGIEDLFTPSDFQQVLKAAGVDATIDDLERGNSVYAKQVNKRLVAHTLLTNAQQYMLTAFEQQTQENVTSLLNFCANDHWFKI